MAEAGRLVDHERMLKSRGEGLGMCMCEDDNFGHAEQGRVSG